MRRGLGFWTGLGFTLLISAFLILPVLGIVEKPKARPPSIADSVRGKKHGGSSGSAMPVGGATPVAAE
jgi:hypothetical protein